MAGNNEQGMAPIDEVAGRIGADVLRVGNVGHAIGVKFGTWWDGTPAVAHTEAAKILEAIRGDDEAAREHTRHALEQQAAAEEREHERLLREQRQRYRKIGGVPVSVPGPDPDWAVDE